jgi:hypothetical protein
MAHRGAQAPRVAAVEHHPHRRALAAVLQRIPDQVAEHLRHALGVEAALQVPDRFHVDGCARAAPCRAHRRAIEAYGQVVATGENLFSTIDVRNLVRFGGMRPGRDVFQMDAGLSYGLTEYARMIGLLEQQGFDRRQCYPHGGHLINLHIVVGLGLGGCEAYPGVFQPFGGYSGRCAVRGSTVRPSDAPGFGLEEKAELAPALQRITG